MLPEKTRLTKQANTRELTAKATGFLAQKLLEPGLMVRSNQLRRKSGQKNTSEQGLTLLECLVAIGVIAVVVTAFTPQIFLAVATQVQNRRAEQALQLAQGEVDRVRRTVELGSYNDETDLPPKGGSDTKRQSAPSSSTTLQPNKQFSSSPSVGVDIDVNGDGTKDFIVQTFRSPGIERSGRTTAFDLGVRVYAFTSNTGTFENPPTSSASLKLTSALGQQQRKPLAMIYTSVAQSDNRNSLCKYRQLPNATGGAEDANNAACQ